MSGPSNRTIIGVAILLFGGVLLGVGIHHMVATGSCSSSGYSSYGPVKRCPAGTGWWFAFLFGGIFLCLIGAFTASAGTVILIIPAIFTAVGLGAMSIVLDSHASSGAKVFGLIFGGVFAAIGIIPAVVIGVGRLRSRGAPAPTAAFGGGGGGGQPDAILGAYAASTATTPTPAAPSTIRPLTAVAPASAPLAAGGDAIEKIARLAELRDKGALTEDEFNREKAKLLAEL
jgi:hypothetical protein